MRARHIHRRIINGFEITDCLLIVMSPSNFVFISHYRLVSCIEPTELMRSEINEASFRRSRRHCKRSEKNVEMKNENNSIECQGNLSSEHEIKRSGLK